MKTTLILTLLANLMLFVTGSAYSKGPKSLIIRVTDYPPHYFKDKSGNWTGIEFDVVAATVKKAGFNYRLVESSWSRAINSIKDGTIHLIMALSYKPERTAFIDYIGITRHEQMSLITLKKNKDVVIKSLDDILNVKKKFGVQYKVDYPNLSDRIKNDKKFAQWFEFVPHEDLNIKKTNISRIFGFFEDKLYAQYKLKHNKKYQDLAVHSLVLTKPIPVYVGATKKLPEETRKKLKQAYKELEKSGELKNIFNKWIKN